MKNLSFDNLGAKLFVLSLWMIYPVMGLTADGGTLTDVLDQYKSSSLSFYGDLHGFALSLLWKLWAIDLAWASIKWALERKPFEELLSHFVNSTFPPLFFVLVIKMGNEWLPIILESFEFFGTKAAGLTTDSGSLDPGLIMEKGIILQNAMVNQFNDTVGTGMISSLRNFLPSLLLMAVCIIILLAFFIMAANVFLVWAEAYLLIGVSPILFAFAGMRWTRDMAPKTFNSMIAAGIKILVLMLLMSTFMKLAPIWAKEAATFQIDDWTPLWRVAFSAAGCAFFAWKAPQIAANALSGTSSLTAGDALQVAAMAAAGALGAAALGGAGASKALDGASNLASKGMDGLKSGMGNIGAPSIEPMDSSSVPDPTGPAPMSDNSTVSTSNASDGGSGSGSGGGNASDANISGGNSGNQNNTMAALDKFLQSQKPPSMSDKLKSGLSTIQSTIPNDQATVGGDAVRMKE